MHTEPNMYCRKKDRLISVIQVVGTKSPTGRHVLTNRWGRAMVHESLFSASRMVYEYCLTIQCFQLHIKKSIARKLQLPIDRLLTNVPENSDCDKVKGIFSALLSSFPSSRGHDLFSQRMAIMFTTYTPWGSVRCMQIFHLFTPAVADPCSKKGVWKAWRSCFRPSDQTSSLHPICTFSFSKYPIHEAHRWQHTHRFRSQKRRMILAVPLISPKPII
jgi:hypothetical protein